MNLLDDEFILNVKDIDLNEFVSFYVEDIILDKNLHIEN